MKIRWAGHAQFVIQTAGATIITDPPGRSYGYPEVKEIPDFVTISHSHEDHSAVETLSGNPQVIRGTGRHLFEEYGLEITGYPCWHDPEQGRLRGNNIIFRIQAEGMNVVHLGDLGERLSDEQVQALGNVDILMIPVGSVYTINASEAFELVQRIQPRIVLPMHYMTPLLSFTLDPAEKFTEKFDEVIYRPFLETDISKLPSKTQAVMLDLPEAE